MKTMRMARPKGKKVYPTSLAFTPEQIEWLNKQPNASEIVRKVLDALIEAGKDVESKLEVISLHKQLEELEKRRIELNNERLYDFILKNRSFWEHKDYNVDWIGAGIKWSKEQPDVFEDDPVPKENEEGRIGAKVLKGYHDAIKVIEQKIAEVKQKILESE